MLHIRGLFETHVTVSDLDRSIAFYSEVVGLELAHVVRSWGAAFLWVGEPGRAMIGLWSTGSAPLSMRLHLAFSASLPDVLATPSRLRAVGVPPLSFDGTPTEEPSVFGWMPAAAVYFDDPDANSLELIAMLPDRPVLELGVVPYREWVRVTAKSANQ